MNRASGIAWGLTALTVAAVASSAAPTASGSGRAPKREPPPSQAFRAYAARPDVPIRQGASLDTPVIGTLGQGSGVLVVDTPGLPDWLEIVREWVDEYGARDTRGLGWLSRSDVVYADPSLSRRPLTNREVSEPVTGATTSGAGRSDAGECDELFHFAGWPGQVDDFKTRLGSVFDDTAATVQNCAGLPQVQKDSWGRFLAEWKTFQARKTDWFGSYGEWKATCEYAKRLDAWRADVLAKAKCEFVGPSNIHGYEIDPSAVSALDSIATTVKWGAIALGGTILLVTLWPEIRGVLGRRS